MISKIYTSIDQDVLYDDNSSSHVFETESKARSYEKSDSIDADDQERTIIGWNLHYKNFHNDSMETPNQNGSQSLTLDVVSTDFWNSVCSNRRQNEFTDG